MKVRVLLVIAAILIMTAVVFGQASLTGKWQTDNVQAALAAQASAAGTEGVRSQIGAPAGSREASGAGVPTPDPARMPAART